MKKFLLSLLSVMTLLPAMAGNNVAPWGWATCSDESGTAYLLNGGNFSNSSTITLTALGNGKTDDTQIKQAIAKNDIIIFDGSNGDFTIGETMKLSSTKNKTIIGINNARLCTKFYLTADDIAYLKAQGLEGLSSTKQITETLPGQSTPITCDERAFYTKKAIMELQYQKTGVYSLPNKSGIFHIETSSENIIIRNLSLIGPGAVDIDGADLITNQGKHVWIDHCTFVDSQDGALDSKVCDWATYTYNHFYYTDRSYSHAYTCGCGWVSNHEMVIHMTFACNIWGAKCMRRLPQADDCFIHLVNNYHNCPGNSVGMTINSYSKALVEGNYAAAGVNKPLDGSGANRNVTAKDNSFANSQAGSVVSVPYDYTKIAAADVPATLTGTEGAGATLGNDADYILSTIPTVSRGETGPTYIISPATHDTGWNFGDISITVSGKDYSEGHVTGDFTGIKFSRNTDYTINLPEGVTITSVEVSAYTNVDTGDLAYVSKLGTNEFNTDSGTFPLRTGKTIETHKYVLSTPASGSMVIRFGGNQATAVIKLTSLTTSIQSVSKDIKNDGIFYNLQGIRVDNPTKGLYIQNGKKVVIK